METYLRKYGLIDNITVTVKTDKQTFARRLAKNVDPGNLGAFSGAFEAWESSNNDYKGQVTNDGFTIRRRKTFFQSQGFSMPIVSGTFKEDRDELVIDAEIKSHTKYLVPILVFGLLFYVVFISVFSLTVAGDENKMLLIVIPFILLHMCMMIGLPYLFMKRSVSRTKRDLERDFFYIAHG